MKKTLNILTIAAILFACNTITKPGNHGTEYAVYDGTPLTHNEDLEPVYVPVDEAGRYRKGDTIWMNKSSNMATDLLIRDAETKQFDTSYVERVIIGDRVYPNKFIK